MYYGFPFRKEDTESEEKTDQFLIQADHDWTTGKRKECFKTLQTQHADEAAENKARLFHQQVITTDKESTPPRPTLSVTNLCRQNGRPPHCMSNYSNNFTLSMPRGARHYEPTCQVPTCLSTVSVAAHRSSNSQLVWGKKALFRANTVIKSLK